MKTTVFLLVIIPVFAHFAPALADEATAEQKKAFNEKYLKAIQAQIEAENKQGIFRLHGKIIAKLSDGLLIECGKFSQFSDRVFLTGHPKESVAHVGGTVEVCVKETGSRQLHPGTEKPDPVTQATYHGAATYPKPDPATLPK